MTDWNVKRQAGNTHAPLNSRQLVEVEARTLGSSLSRFGAGLVHPPEHLVLFAVIIRVGLLKIITVVFPLRGRGRRRLPCFDGPIDRSAVLHRRLFPFAYGCPRVGFPPGTAGRSGRRGGGTPGTGRLRAKEGEGNKQLVDVN